MHALAFNGRGKPEECEAWLLKVEKILESMECPEEKWVRLASFLLEGDADQWWRATGRRKFLNLDLLMISWGDFWDVFYEKYFLDHERDRLDREFRSLKQGSKSVVEYEATFSRLERFTQSLDIEECRAKRFVEGLNPVLRLKVMGYRCWTLLDVVDWAFRFEDEHKRYIESQPKGKGKMFALRPSTSWIRSSESSRSSGKKRKERSEQPPMGDAVLLRGAVPDSVRQDLAVACRWRELVLFADRWGT